MNSIENILKNLKANVTISRAVVVIILIMVIAGLYSTEWGNADGNHHGDKK